MNGDGNDATDGMPAARRTVGSPGVAPSASPSGLTGHINVTRLAALIARAAAASPLRTSASAVTLVPFVGALVPPSLLLRVRFVVDIAQDLFDALPGDDPRVGLERELRH